VPWIAERAAAYGLEVVDGPADGTGHVAKLKLAELFPETELVSFHDKKM